MAELSRRRFLAAGLGVAAGAAAGVSLGGSGSAFASVPAFTSTPFALGVASGDAWSDSVVLWTRLAPDPTVSGYGMSGQPSTMSVKWRIAHTTADLAADSTSVDYGTFDTVSDDVHSVHAIAQGLSPATSYVYQFWYTEPNGKKWASPVGHTRTAAAAGSTGAVRFAVVSCQTIGTASGGWRYFNGYGYMNDNASALDLDFVVQIGDYIYADPVIDASDPTWDHGCATLPDYRLRYGRYRMRSSLQDIHRNKPFYCSPDDHEWWNNVHGGERDLTAGTIDGHTIEQFDWGMRAYWEHMPLRYRPVYDSSTGIRDVQFHRNISWGPMYLHLLDTRQWRTKPGSGTGATLMGADQRQELLDHISGSTETWNCILSQVPMGEVVNSSDKWVGYPYERGIVTSALASPRANGTVPNAVVVSGDIHVGAVAKVNQQGTNTFIATEFVGPPMTSGDTSSLTTNATIDHVFKNSSDNVGRGFVLCHVDSTQFAATYYTGHDVSDPNGAVYNDSTWKAVPGRIGATKV